MKFFKSLKIVVLFLGFACTEYKLNAMNLANVQGVAFCAAKGLQEKFFCNPKIAIGAMVIPIAIFGLQKKWSNIQLRMRFFFPGKINKTEKAFFLHTEKDHKKYLRIQELKRQENFARINFEIDEEQNFKCLRVEFREKLNINLTKKFEKELDTEFTASVLEETSALEEKSKQIKEGLKAAKDILRCQAIINENNHLIMLVGKNYSDLIASFLDRYVDHSHCKEVLRDNKITNEADREDFINKKRKEIEDCKDKMNRLIDEQAGHFEPGFDDVKKVSFWHDIYWCNPDYTTVYKIVRGKVHEKFPERFPGSVYDHSLL